MRKVRRLAPPAFVAASRRKATRLFTSRALRSRSRAAAARLGALAAVAGLLAVSLDVASATTGPLAKAATPLALSPKSFVMVWSTGSIPGDRGGPIAESSPTVATLDAGGPAVVVGDRTGYLYAYHLSNGSAVEGWPVYDGGAPIDSTPSVAALGGGQLDSVFFGAGNAEHPGVGGYEAYGPGGSALWATRVQDPSSDAQPAYGVQASLTVASLQAGMDVFAGSLDQESYALDASNGSVLEGWPFFSADSVFSTAAAGDFYGNGQVELAVGGASSAGFAHTQTYHRGGHLRLLNSRGGLICHYDTNQEVDSSPAVGGFLAGGATGVVVGTGSYFASASETDALMAFDTRCDLVWSDTLNGITGSSPGLGDVEGNGSLDVVQGADNGVAGSVWVINGTNGVPVWHQFVVGRVIGSVVTADLSGAGYQDVLVPTTHGVEVFDGRSGAEVTVLGKDLGFQDSPLVTDDPNGEVGITIAGYNGTNEGAIEHFEIPGSDGLVAASSGSWPMFHHDPQLTGVTSGLPAQGSIPACDIPAAAVPGYNLATSNGVVLNFGQPPCTPAGTQPARPDISDVVGMAMAPDMGGYWLVVGSGAVYAFGEAQYYGSMGGQYLNAPIVGIAANPDGHGYWLVAADGGVYAYGDARYFGSLGSRRVNAPIVAMGATPDGHGYWLVAADGGVFGFGDAHYHGSMSAGHLNSPVVGIATDIATGSYWLVAADGGVFAFGAPYEGSVATSHLSSPVVGMAATADGRGYWLVATDGTVFGFGDADYLGSTRSSSLNGSAVAIAGYFG